jgi:hypothetical protein
MTGRPDLRLNDPVLSVIVAVCSLMSVGAFLLDAFGIVGMPFTLSAVSFPALVLTVALAVWAGRMRRYDFLRRLYMGLVIGLIATLVYDALRGVVYVLTPTDFNPFRAHRNFGALILDTSPHTTGALVAGWVYHFWNGISFAVIFTMLAPGRPWYWALTWAMALETATVLVYPNVFGIDRTDIAFLSVSFAGHAAYGTTMGLLGREWLGLRAGRGSPWALSWPNLRRAFT